MELLKWNRVFHASTQGKLYGTSCLQSPPRPMQSDVLRMPHLKSGSLQSSILDRIAELVASSCEVQFAAFLASGNCHVYSSSQKQSAKY